MPHSKKAIVYQCNFCDFQTDGRHLLRWHLDRCRKGKGRQKKTKKRHICQATFKCEYCSFAADTLDKLMRHKLIHADLIDLGLIECSHCPLKFFTIEECKMHMKASASNSGNNDDDKSLVVAPEYVDVSSLKNITVKVEGCASDEDQMQIAQNELKKSPESLNIECTPEILIDGDQYAIASNLEKKGGLYVCPCNKSKYHSNYMRHMKNVHKAKAGSSNRETVKIEESPLSCPTCFRRADNQLQLSVHLVLEHVAEDGKFKCLKPSCLFNAACKHDMKLHLLDVHKLGENHFRPLADPPEADKSSFTCPKCSHSADNEILLTIHEICIHTKKGYGHFKCPWPKCDSEFQYQVVLKSHLRSAHGADGITSPKQRWEVENELLVCEDCGHKSKTELQMKIHRAMAHHPKGQTAFTCPASSDCPLLTTYKHHIKRHLKRMHKLVDDDFRDYGAKEPDLDSSEPEKDEETNEEDADEIPDQPETRVIDYHYTNDPVSTDSNKWNKCRSCRFTTTCKTSMWRHTQRLHGQKQCNICNVMVDGKYQLYWHKYCVHRISQNIDQWTLICALCFLEGSPEDSYKHGRIHRSPTVTFQTVFCKVPTGVIEFRYPVQTRKGPKRSNSKRLNNNSEGNLKNAGEDSKFCVAPSAVKVLDWTMSDNDEPVTKTLTRLETSKDVTIEFAHSDDEVKSDNDDSDVGVATPTKGLLMKQSEFLTCKECIYETKDASLMNIHELLVHADGATRTKKSGNYQCPEVSCEFESKYKANFKRHLTNTHKLKCSDLWVAGQEEYPAKARAGKEPDNEGIKAKKPKTNSDPEWDPATDPDQRYLKRQTRSTHRSKAKLVCPHLHCRFTTDRTLFLKKHLEGSHKIAENQVQELQPNFTCSKCNFQTVNDEELKNHVRTRHKRCGAKKNVERLNSWRLKCPLCPYETFSKKSAYKHGCRHYRSNNAAIAIFSRFYKGQQRGFLKFTYSNKKHQCTNCKYVGLTALDLFKHNLRHHRPDLESSYRQQAQATTQIAEKTIKKEEGDGHDCSPNQIKEESTTTPERVEELNRDIKQKGKKKDLRGKKPKNTREKVVAVSKDQEKQDEDYSDKTASYSLEELQKILGIVSENAPEENKNKDNTEIEETNWISQIEKDVNDDKYEPAGAGENEIIRIEVTEDSDEENVEAFEDESISQDANIKCKNKGCKYSSHDREDALKHAESCDQKSSVCCNICELVLTDKKSLQVHIISQHLGDSVDEPAEQKKNPTQSPKPKRKRTIKKIIRKQNNDYGGIPGRISFKCWMCGYRFFYHTTLENHTYIHAREDSNFNLKVRFSKYKGETMVDTIVVEADANYVPRKKHSLNRSPPLDYNPELPVFSCNECNFKTNSVEALTKHKNLHWSAEKEAAYKAQKWYTCGVCFFHCFDLDKFKEHGEKHKKQPGWKLDVNKIAKDSWFF